MFEQSPLVGFGTASAATHAMEMVMMLVVAFALGYVLARVMGATRRPRVGASDDSVAHLATRKNPLTTSIAMPAADVMSDAEVSPEVTMVDAGIAASPAPATVESSTADTPTAPPSPAKRDNLKKIEGIGAKIERILRNEGIHTFAQLATTDETALKEILLRQSERFRLHNPRDWPKQAALARDSDWDGLKKMQAELRAVNVK